MVKIELKDNYGTYKYIFDNKTGQTDFYKDNELRETTWHPYCQEEFIAKIKESVDITNEFNKCQELRILKISN